MARSIVVTGAGTGIGLGVAQRLAQRGFAVFGSVRSTQAAALFEATVGHSAKALVFDVTDEAGVREGAAQVAHVLGGARLFGLVNNAGIAVPGPLLHLTAGELRQQMEVNLIGVHHVTQSFAPLLGAESEGASARTGAKGRIVMISSVGGRNGAPFIGAYAASKHALEGYSESLRRELMLYGVDVVIVAPGAVATPIWDKAESEGLSRYGHTEYGPIIAKFQDYFLKQGRNGLPPEAIGRLVERLLTQNAPPVRTTILRDKFMQNTLPSLMPKRMVDGIIARMFGLKAKP